MSKLDNLALASNEARNQRIIQLRQAFAKQQIITVESAVKQTGYTRTTVISWAKQGNIPLWDAKRKQSVVPLTDANTPSWMRGSTEPTTK